jgi:hypothetical protein
MPCASVVALTRLAVEPGDSPHTFDASSEIYDFNGETLQKRGTIMHVDTIRGTRSASKERSRPGPYFIAGALSMPVDVAAMDAWLPRILGATESTDSFALAETLPAFGMLADLIGNTHEFKDCVVARAVFTGEAFNGNSAPKPLNLELSIMGKSEAVGTSFPAVTLSTAANTAPLMFEDGVISMQSGNRDVMKFSLVIDNMLQVRWTNSLAPTCIYPAGRRVTFSCITPYTSSESSALYNQSSAGAAATLTFTNGNTSLAFSMPALQVPSQTPVAVGRGEVVLQLEGVARKSGSTAELTVTNDSTV